MELKIMKRTNKDNKHPHKQQRITAVPFPPHAGVPSPARAPPRE